MRHLECQLEEKNQELLRVSHGGHGGAMIWYFSTMYNLGLLTSGVPESRVFLSYQVDVTFTWNHAFLGGSVFCLVGQKPQLHQWRCGAIGTRCLVSRDSRFGVLGLRRLSNETWSIYKDVKSPSDLLT